MNKKKSSKYKTLDLISQTVGESKTTKNISNSNHLSNFKELSDQNLFYPLTAKPTSFKKINDAKHNYALHH